MKKVALACLLLVLGLGCWAREGTEWVVSYHYNGNLSDRPRVLLIGDSICNGYQPMVRDNLAGTAYVSFLATSKCITDPSFLKLLAYTLGEYDYAVIQLNNGLHSLSADPVKWEQGLRAAIMLIKEQCPKTKIVWASCTPLKDSARTEKVIRINAIAQQVMLENNIPINDLYTPMNLLDRNRYWVDTYHFNGDARKMQAKLVSDEMLKSLGKKSATAVDASAALRAAASETGPDGKIATEKKSVDYK